MPRARGRSRHDHAEALPAERSGGTEALTRDEILAEITRACSPAHIAPASDEGYTVKELADAWGCGVHKARMRVKAAMEAGRLTRGQRYYEDTVGRIVPVPVYRAAA